MENSHFDNDTQPKTPETLEDTDEDDEESVFSKMFSRSKKENNPQKNDPEAKVSQESKNTSGIFERFKKRADGEAVNKPGESEDGGLEQEDKRIVASTVAEAMASQIPEHSAEEEITGETAADVAAREFLEEVAVTGDPDAAATRKMTELNLDPAVVAEYEQAEKPARDEPELESGDDVKESEPTQQLDGIEDEPDEADHQTQSSHVSSGNGGSVPPPPPSGENNGLHEEPEEQPPGGPPLSGRTRGVPPLVPMPTMSGNIAHAPDTPAVERYDQGNPAVTALIGGIIGYYIGRRRGRIKTEKKLLPIQKKLEHQVEDLHWEIKRKEIAIRKAASKKVRRDGPLVLAAVVANRAAKVGKILKTDIETTQNSVAPEREDTERQNIERRRHAPEAGQLHGPVKTQEKIGHMLINAEAAQVVKREKVPTEKTKEDELFKRRYNELPVHLRERNIETLNRNDLLSLSEKIVLDGSSLRQIYETHLIGERGLRRLVAEYLHGGDVKKILRKEIVDHEIDFERDPAVRDITVPTSTAPAPASVVVDSKIALDKLVEKASVSFGDSNAEAYYKARAVYEAEDNRQQKNKSQLVGVGMAATITVLLAIVIVLYFTRH
jgi:hypothetical protein